MSCLLASDASPLAEALNVCVQVPFSLVFTKTDKRKKRCPGASENIAAFQAQLLAGWEVRFSVSAFNLDVICNT